MSAIQATFLNGMIVPDEPPRWAEGARLTVDLKNDSSPEDDEDVSPEAIAGRLALMDQLLELPVMPDSEFEAWEQQQREAKQRELADWGNWVRRVGADFP